MYIKNRYCYRRIQDFINDGSTIENAVEKKCYMVQFSLEIGDKEWMYIYTFVLIIIGLCADMFCVIVGKEFFIWDQIIAEKRRERRGISFRL